MLLLGRGAFIEKRQMMCFWHRGF